MQESAYHAPEEFVYDAPERTSVLAILALISSLICFLPLTGVLAIGLGVLALIGIGSSKGRVKGTGLAVAGIVIGLLVSVVWIGMLFAVQQGLQQFPNMAQSITHVENSEYDKVRESLSPSAQQVATDEAIEQFRDAYQAELGTLVQIPGGWDIISSFAELGPVMQQFNSGSMPYQGSMIPVPAEFSQGKGLIILAFDPSAGEGPSGMPLYINLGVATPAGDTKWLYEPSMALPSAGDSEGETSEGDSAIEGVEPESEESESADPASDSGGA